MTTALQQSPEFSEAPTGAELTSHRRRTNNQAMSDVAAQQPSKEQQLSREKQDNKLMVYLTNDQRAEIRAAAEENGLKESPFILFMFRQWRKDHPPEK